MNRFLIAAIALTFLAATPVYAAGATYRNASTHSFGNSHNNYHGVANDYGASHNNYNGTQTYANPSPYTNHPSDYSTSRQAMDTSVPY